jgi:hypothetical protein
MSEMPVKEFPFAKIVIGMAVCLLVGIGLCGLDAALGAHHIGKPPEEFGVGPIDGLSLLVMVLSAAGLVLALIAWAVAGIVGAMAKEDNRQGPE